MFVTDEKKSTDLACVKRSENKRKTKRDRLKPFSLTSLLYDSLPHSTPKSSVVPTPNYSFFFFFCLLLLQRKSLSVPLFLTFGELNDMDCSDFLPFSIFGGSRWKKNFKIFVLGNLLIFVNKILCFQLEFLMAQ